jgi:hypothetical protein
MAIPAGRGNTRVRVLVGCVLVALFCWQFGREPDSSPARAGRTRSVIPPALASPTPFSTPTISNDELAATDPLGFLRSALQRYQKSISDYTCTFTKQERIRGKLGPEQQIQVRFREMPFSVLMEWTHNPDQARRVLYVQGQWQNDDGEDLAKVEPQGAIARLLVRSVALPISGPAAKAQSRRTIDQFGFGNALKLIIDYASLAIASGKGSLVYEGIGQIDGRTTWIFKRTLPYAADGGPWPDRVLIVHIDREWLLPLACYTFADDAQRTVLARYEFSGVHLNTGLTSADFDAQANGF